ncbi:MAG: hypothetical protein Q9N02_06480 [Ghiorsea sp.]|nr:hypothetical protein [Ghiorsea sp.]
MEKSKLKYPLTLSVILLVLISAIFSTYSVRDVVSMGEATGFHLDTNLIYLLFSPLFNLLDMMSALSLTQHLAWVIFVLLFGACVGFIFFKRQVLWLRLLFSFVFSVLLLVMLYSVAILMPRPMVKLVKPDAAVLVVDFHSHTDASHDANKSFSPEDNRKWHSYAGFDAAFVTDHSTFIGSQAGKAQNPRHAREGVLLLDGVEVRYQGGHVLALCATTMLPSKEEDYIWKTNEYGCKPLLVQANPGPIEDSNQRFKERSIGAIEIHDGAPLALEDIKNREQWLNKAKSLDIAIVSGSDNHGWAYAASGWSLLRITGWQNMGANRLALAITHLIHEQGFQAVQVVERNMVLPAQSILEHVLMPARLIWRMFQVLTWQERLSWLVWVILLTLLSGQFKEKRWKIFCSQH